MAFYPIQAQKFQLAGSGVGSTDTSITLTSFAMTDGTLITTADIGAIGYITLEPGTSRMESISFTGVTQNANGTATLTGVTRGLDFDEPYAETAGLKKSHGGNTNAVLSNTASFYSQFGIKQNDETVPGAWTFSQVPSSDADATSSNDLVRYSQLQSAVLGTLLSSPVVIPGNAGETLAIDTLVYLKASDQEWYKADADTASLSENVFLGITRGAGTDGAAITNGITILGEHEAGSAIFTAGLVYASDTAGAFASSAGTNEVIVGIATSTTVIDFNPRFSQQLTEDQIAALAGTSGTPASGNEYVTSNDVSNAAASGKIVRATGTALPALDGSNLTGLRTVTTLTAGENLSADDAVVIGDNTSEILSNLGGTTSTESISSVNRIAQLITTASDTVAIAAVAVSLTTGSGSGTTEVTVEIYADSAGVPTGSVLGTVTRSSLGITGSSVDYTFTFATPVSVSASTNYHVVVYRSGTSQTTLLNRNDTASQGTTKSTDSGSSFSAINGAMDVIVYDINHTSGSVYQADASTDNFRANAFVGFVESAVTSGDPASVVNGLVIRFLSGLTPGSLYYLSDTTGQISTTAGSQNRLIGRALSATELLVTHKDMQ